MNLQGLSEVRLRKVDPASIHIVQPFYEEDNLPTQLLPKLFIGSIKCANNHEALKEEGITHILTVCSEKIPDTTGFVSLQLPFLDSASVDLSLFLDRCLEFIEKGRKEGGGVLVHCMHGVSRSGAVCIAYMMKENQTPFLQTWREAKTLRRVIHPNDSFKTQLTAFEKKFSSSSSSQSEKMTED